MPLKIFPRISSSWQAKGRTFAPLLVLLLSTSGIGHASSPEEKQQCLAAHESGQGLRKQSKFKEARAQFARCSQSACPGPVAEDCSRWGTEVLGEMPTVVFAGVGANGKETSRIKVRLDGEPLVDTMDGKSVEVDPGEHTFHYEFQGEEKEERLVIRAGEKNRLLKISFQSKTPAAKPPEQSTGNVTKNPSKTPADPPEQARPPTRSKPVQEPTTSSSPLRTVALVTGGVGLTLGAGFGLWALSLKSTVNEKCNPSNRTCSDEEGREAARTGSTVSTVSTVSAVVGLVGLGTWLLWPSSKEKQSATLDAFPVAGGGLMQWRGRW